jgi:hypothetical protein
MKRGRIQWGPGNETRAHRELFRLAGIPDGCMIYGDVAIAAQLGITRQHVHRLRTAPASCWHFFSYEGLRLTDPRSLLAGWITYRTEITNPSSGAA